MKKRIIYICLFYLTLVISEIFAAWEWDDTAWPHRQQIIIKSSHKDFAFLDKPLENFPVLIRIDSSVPHFFENSGPLLFTTPGGKWLPHEIEYLNAGEKVLYAWVALPSFSHSKNSEIFLYYGNNDPAASSVPGQSVWDDDYSGVWHLNETGGADTLYMDSTANRFIGTREEATSPERGAIYNGQKFTGKTNGIIYSRDFEIREPTGLTVETWFSPGREKENGENSFTILGLSNNLILKKKSSHLLVVPDTDRTEGRPITSDMPIPEDSRPVHGAFTWSSVTNLLYIYINGVPALKIPARIGSDTLGSIIPGTLTIGGTANRQFPELFSGMIDEVRLSGKARSANWIRSSFLIQADDRNYLQFTRQIRISGGVYKDDRFTPVGAGIPVALAVNGRLHKRVFTGETGEYCFLPDTNTISAGDRISIYLDTNGGNRGTTVSLAGNTNLEGVDIVYNYLIIRNDYGESFPGELLAGNGGAHSGDSDIPYKEDSRAIKVEKGFTLYIPGGMFLEQNRELVTGVYESTPLIIDGTLRSSAPLTVNGSLSGKGALIGGGAEIKIAKNLNISIYRGSISTIVDGNWNIESYTHNTGAVSLRGNGKVNNSVFYNLALLSGKRTLEGDLTVEKNFKLISGALIPGAHSIQAAGHWDDSAIEFTPYAGGIFLTGDDVSVIQGEYNRFHNLDIAKNGSLESTIRVSGNLEFSGTLKGGEHTIEVAGNWSNYGDFEAENSTVVFSDTSKPSRILGSNWFNNFTCRRIPGKRLQFENGSTQSIKGLLDIEGIPGDPVILEGMNRGSWNLLAEEHSPIIKNAFIRNCQAGEDNPITAHGTIDGGGNSFIDITPPGKHRIWVGGYGRERRNWHLPANWRPRNIPDGEDEIAVIPGDTFYKPQLTQDTIIGGLVIDDSAELTTGDHDLNITGPLINLGTIRCKAGTNINRIDINSGTVIYYGTTALPAVIQDYGFVDYYNLILNDKGASFVLPKDLVVANNLEVCGGVMETGSSNVIVKKDVRVKSGATLKAGKGQLKIDGSVEGSGHIYGESAVIRIDGDFNIKNCSGTTSSIIVSGDWGVQCFDHNTSEVVFNGDGRLYANTFYNIVIARGNRTLEGPVVVEYNLSIGKQGILTPGENRLNVIGNLTGEGHLEGGAGILDLNGNISLSSLRASSTHTYVSGDIYEFNRFDHNYGTITFDGKSRLTGGINFFNLSITGKGSLDTGSQKVVIENILQNNGTIHRQGTGCISRTDSDSGTVVYSGPGSRIQHYPGKDYYNLTIDGGEFLPDDDLHVRGGLHLKAGTLRMAGKQITLEGNWLTENGSPEGSGTVKFTGGNSESIITGKTVFPDLVCREPGKVLVFDHRTVHTVKGKLDIGGLPGKPVFLKSLESGIPWKLNIQADQQGRYVHVNDGDIANDCVFSIILEASEAGNNCDRTTGDGDGSWDVKTTSYTWQGTMDNSWDNPGNWIPVKKSGPGEWDTVYIPKGPVPMPVLTGNEVHIEALYIEKEASLDTGNSKLYISGELENLGTIKRRGINNPTEATLEGFINKNDPDSGKTVYYGGGSYLQDYGFIDYFDLELEDSDIILENELRINNHLTIKSGASLGTAANPIIIGGNWTNSGAFNHSNGEVYFIDNQKPTVIRGNNIFYNLSCTTAGKRLFFSGGNHLQVLNRITVRGKPGSMVCLEGENKSRWTLTVLKKASIQYTRIDGSNLKGGISITASSSVNGGYNDVSRSDDPVLWNFADGFGFYTWTGKGGNSDWNNEQNWSGTTGYPLKDDTAVIAPATFHPQLTGNTALANLLVLESAILDINNNELIISGNLENHGTIYRTPGSIINRTDTDSGTVEYGGQEGIIQDYSRNGIDYYNLVISSLRTGLTKDLYAAGDLRIEGALDQQSNLIKVDGNMYGKGRLLGGTGPVEAAGDFLIANYTATSSYTIVSGDWDVLSFSHNSGNIIFNGDGKISSGGFRDFTLESGTRILSGAVRVEGDLTIRSGTLAAGEKSNIITLSGSWMNRAGPGGFVHNGNSVILEDHYIDSVISGSSVFNNFTCKAPGKTILFEAGSEQVVEGVLTLQGSEKSSLIVESTSPGTPWRLHSKNSLENIHWIFVSNSHTRSGDESGLITVAAGFDGPNNTGWDIAAETVGPGILSAVTEDSNTDGFTDRLKLTFTKSVVSETINPGAFSLDKGELISITDDSNHDDSVIWINIRDGLLPTDSTPELSITGEGISDFFGNVNLPVTDYRTTDGALPVLLVAEGTAGKSKLNLRFSEPLFKKTAMNNKSIPVYFGKGGTINNTVLHVTPVSQEGSAEFTATTAKPFIEQDFFIQHIRVEGLSDMAGNSLRDDIHTPIETWLDIVKPDIEKAVTVDFNSNGYIDALHIHFNDAVYDTSIDASAFNISGVSGESFSSTTNGDTVNDNDIYVTFDDNILDTGATPDLIYDGKKLTDTALNPMIFPLKTTSVDGAPPVILYSLAVAGYNHIYLKFSETVQPATSHFLPGTFSLSSHKVKTITPSKGTTSHLLLTLKSDILPAHVIRGDQLRPAADYITDASTLSNPLSQNGHNISDLGLGFIEPLWATDGTPLYETYDKQVVLRRFDGTGWLQDKDITLEAVSYDTVISSREISLVFDVNVPTDLKEKGIWLPEPIPGMVEKKNHKVRNLEAVRAAQQIRDFLIPARDNEITNGAELEFIFKVGDLYCTGVRDPRDPSSVKPWSINIRDEVQLVSKVDIQATILNPVAGGEVKIAYTLESKGRVTIRIFDLKGDVVKVLEDSEVLPGGHTAAWKGRKSDGSLVPRGIYLISVQSPDFDETGKIMVVN